MPKHNVKHLMSHTPEYRAWDNARGRCYRKKDRKYPLYGARGITMCDEWRSDFRAFLRDMGRKPSPKHSLERKDSNGDYMPENCCWATIDQQNNNRRFNRFLLVEGDSLTIAQAARKTGVPQATILGRLNRGLSDEEAIRG